MLRVGLLNGGEVAAGRSVRGVAVLSYDHALSTADQLLIEVVGRVVAPSWVRDAVADAAATKPAEGAAPRSENTAAVGELLGPESDGLPGLSDEDGAAESAEQDDDEEAAEGDEGPEQLDPDTLFLASMEPIDLPPPVSCPAELVYRFAVPLPRSLPPSFAGNTVRYAYAVVVTAVRGGCRVAEVRLPVAVPVRAMPLRMLKARVTELPRGFARRPPVGVVLASHFPPSSAMSPRPGAGGPRVPSPSWQAWWQRVLAQRAALEAAARDDSAADDWAVRGGAGAGAASATFNITKSQRTPAPRQDPVVRVLVAQRRVARGDMVRIHLDFSNRVLPCYRVEASLERVERATGWAETGPRKPARRVAADAHVYSLNTESCSVVLPVPPDAVPSFATPHVDLSWVVRFKFVIRSQPPPEAWPAPRAPEPAGPPDAPPSSSPDGAAATSAPSSPTAGGGGFLSRMLSPLARIGLGVLVPGGGGKSRSATAREAEEQAAQVMPSAERLRGQIPDPFLTSADVECLTWELPLEVVSQQEGEAEVEADAGANAARLLRLRASAAPGPEEPTSLRDGEGWLEVLERECPWKWEDLSLALPWRSGVIASRGR